VAAVGKLAYLNAALTTELSDSSHLTWSSAEKDQAINEVVADLYPRVSRVLDPDSVAVALDDNVYFYPLPYYVMNVSRVDWLNEDDFDEYGELENGLWSFEGDPDEGTATLRVDPFIVAQGGVLRCYAYARYDTASNPIPMQYVSEVLARAKVKLLRSIATDRSRFTAWLSRDQGQNVSVNELLQQIRESDQEADRLESKHKVWQRPVPGRA
jgi:hypothetical protein